MVEFESSPRRGEVQKSERVIDKACNTFAIGHLGNFLALDEEIR